MQNHDTKPTPMTQMTPAEAKVIIDCYDKCFDEHCFTCYSKCEAETICRRLSLIGAKHSAIIHGAKTVLYDSTHLW